jgi:hypothetical protein
MEPLPPRHRRLRRMQRAPHLHPQHRQRRHLRVLHQPRPTAPNLPQPHHRAADVEAGVEAEYQKIELNTDARDRIRTAIRHVCAARRKLAGPELAKAIAELDRLKAREKKLLHAHYDDTISSELFRDEQRQLQRERLSAEATVAQYEMNDDALVDTLDQAIELTDRIYVAYLRAKPDERRLFNQALFSCIWIDNGTATRSELADPFARLIAVDNDDLRAAAQLTGLDTSELARRLDPDGDASKQPDESSENVKTSDPSEKVAGSNVIQMVEPGGLEPPTSCLQSRRSPS